MKRQLAPGLEIRKSAIEGHGCFATAFFPKNRKIAEYAGELISYLEVARRVRHRKKLRICAVNRYWSIDGSRGGNGTHYVNHSCEPNSYMKILYGHILFMALRDIHPGEEITLDYVTTHHSDTKRCHCKAPSCRGTINLRMN
ncbi:MAG TPA: SET domain-containing protein-lysine N-methyltransferase [Pyrinomonadaceae bacterium]|jgi:SET domain-containing protein|nr:SET domain-containing protein-lysine N-methyltransferase [Pyrinomonadaceae bacterium]